MKSKTIKRSKGEIVFEVFNLFFLSMFTFACLFPFLNMLAKAFSGDAAITAGYVSIWPVDFQTEAFIRILQNKKIVNSLFITVVVTSFGTLFSMILTVFTAYPLSRKDLKGRKFFLSFVLITMLFSGGMIPTFLVVKGLKLLNTIWALIIPGALSTFNLIIMKTFFESVPNELQEAAKIDGCNNMLILFKIYIPLSMAAIATLTLFYAVSNWNNYFNAMFYIDNPDLYTLQVKLRQLLLAGKSAELLEGQEALTAKLSEEALKASTIVFSTLPILIVYPWLQKYFVKGVTIGAVKG